MIKCVKQHADWNQTHMEGLKILWLMIWYLGSSLKIKKALRETQNLRAGCSKAAQLLDVAKRPIPQG